MSLLQKHRRIW